MALLEMFPDCLKRVRRYLWGCIGKSSVGILALFMMFVMLVGCEKRVPDNYKKYMCLEAERGAEFRCQYLGISEETCANIASEAFRVCYGSLPEEYAD